MKLYVYIAQNLGRIERLHKDGRSDFAERIREDMENFVKANLPRGSGFDMGTTLNFDKSSPDRLVFNTSFHHMNDAGFYDGWTEHEVRVSADLQFGFKLTVGGKDRRAIKAYIAEQFHYIMERDEAFKFLI